MDLEFKKENDDLQYKLSRVQNHFQINIVHQNILIPQTWVNNSQDTNFGGQGLIARDVMKGRLSDWTTFKLTQRRPPVASDIKS